MLEPLNELGHDGRGLVVHGRHWLILGNTDEVIKNHRTLAYEMFHSPLITFSTYDSEAKYHQNFVTKVFYYFFLIRYAIVLLFKKAAA